MTNYEFDVGKKKHLRNYSPLFIYEENEQNIRRGIQFL
jgi:hypothetical protein